MVVETRGCSELVSGGPVRRATRVGATNGYRNRRRRRTKWLGKTTDEPVEEIGEFVTQ